MGGKDEKLACFKLVSLAPEYVVYERATSQLRLDRQHLYIVTAVDWCSHSARKGWHFSPAPHTHGYPLWLGANGGCSPLP